MDENRAWRLRFRGNVQGVGFRAHVRHHCRAAGVSGWVRNLDDGSVEAEMVGTVGILSETVRRIRSERTHQISSVDQFEVCVSGPITADFEIRR